MGAENSTTAAAAHTRRMDAVLALVFQSLRALYSDGRTERTVVLPEPTR